MSGNTISTSDTKIEALSLQSSAYGVTIPLLYGVNRIAGNMVWYGGFKATPHTTESSGKGGSVNTQNTTFVYTASVMMGLCEGQITGISRAWKGKKLYAGGVSPSALTTTTEAYTVPAGGGSFTVAQALNFSASVSVSYASIGASDAGRPLILADGYDYTRIGGVYAFDARWAGVTMQVAYQYAPAAGAQTALQALGLSFAAGALGQAVWPYLTATFPSQAIGYSGLAMVYAQDYLLGTGAQVDNHTFEVQGPQAYSIGATIPDANPAVATWDALINGRYGAAFPSAQLGSPELWSAYCLASGLLLSPALHTQMQASEFAALMGKLTNTAPVWSSGKLKMIPYGDATLTGNGATYTPNVTPLYDLGYDDFLAAAGSDPVKVTRKPQADAFNHVRIEFCNRANLYNLEIAEAKDSANIDANGLRTAPILSAHWVCDASVARQVAQLLMQRTLYVRNSFEFTLPWTKAMLEPMSLVTITDAGLGFTKLPVRITEITESEDGALAVVAEEFPLGVATAALYPTQTGAGFQHNYGAAPGSISAPVIFEAPGALTTNGLELYVAAAGASALWGGCHVWVSLDGTSYKQVGTINGGSRYGTLNGTPSGGSVHVSLVAGALTSGSNADAVALNTLCFIGGASREYFTYATATLTAALAYDLTYVSTGVYGSQVGGHSSGDPFVRVDASIAKSGPIDLGYIGKTVHVKCTSFNVYGAAEESLAAVVDYTYAITGSQVLGNAGASALAGIGAAVSDGVLSAGEKPPVILDYNTIISNQAGISAQAAAYGKDHGTFDAAITALTNYLATLTTPTAWNNLSGSTTADGPTTRGKFLAVYAAQQALLNATASAAGLVATWAGIPAGSGKAADNATVGATWGSNLTGQPADAALLNSLQQWAQINGAGKPSDNATVGATWGSNLTGQPADSALLNALQQWAQVSGAGKPSDNATVGATWGNNLTGQPADAALLNSLQQWAQVNGAGKPSDNATVGATWGSNLTGQPADSALLNSLQQWAQVSGAGKPADNATKNVVSYQAAAPTNPTNGDLWFSVSTSSWETFTSGAWQLVSDITAANIAKGIANQGSLATLNAVDTPQILDNSVSYRINYFDAAGVDQAPAFRP